MTNEILAVFIFATGIAIAVGVTSYMIGRDHGFSEGAREQEATLKKIAEIKVRMIKCEAVRGVCPCARIPT